MIRRRAFGYIDPLGPGGVIIWHNGTRSILVQAMAWCWTAPSHHLNQFYITSGGLHFSPEVNLAGKCSRCQSMKLCENYTFEITATFPEGQWVNF